MNVRSSEGSPVKFKRNYNTSETVRRWFAIQELKRSKFNLDNIKLLILLNFKKITSRCRRCSVRKGVLTNFTKFTGNACVRISFLIKLQAEASSFIKKRTLSQVFSFHFCEISKNTFFSEDTAFQDPDKPEILRSYEK